MNVSSESILAGEIMCSSSGSRRFVSAATASVALLAIGVIGLSKDGPVRSEPAGKIPAQPQFVDDQASPAALKSLADRLTVQLKKDTTPPVDSPGTSTLLGMRTVTQRSKLSNDVEG